MERASQDRAGVVNLSGFLISDANDDIGGLHDRPVRQVALQEEGGKTLFHIDEIAGIHIVEVVVAARIGVVKGLGATDMDLPHQALFGKQAKGIVDSRFGYLGTGLIHKHQQLVGREMLVAGKQHISDGAPLRCHEYTSLRQPLFN